MISITNLRKKEKGITLIALVITIIVLLILAAVSIATLTGENGILGKGTKATEETKKATAKEILAITLLGAGQEKYTNSDYNQNEWLDTYIKEQNKEHDINIDGDIVYIDGWGFEIDRSIPTIKEELGQNGKDTSIRINLKQAISVQNKKIKIEIIANKEIKTIKVNEETITVPVKENGKYTIEKEVQESGNYEITAIANDDKWNTATIEVTEEIPIYDKEDMALFRDLVNAGNTFEGKTVVLKNDIDLEGSPTNQWTPIGTADTQFQGIFDGSNKTIKGLYMDRGDLRDLGLFYTAPKAEVKGVKIENCYINSTWNNTTKSGYVGGICGDSIGRVKQCSVTGTLSFNYGENVTVNTWLLAIGGIAGYAVNDTKIEECYNGANLLVSVKKSSNIATQVRAGGIVSSAKSANIKNCYNTGNITTITTSTQENCWKGGILGLLENYTLNIEDSYNLGTINEGGDVGGILGLKGNGSTIHINNCYYLNTCGGSNTNGGVALTQQQIQTPTFANILNKKETYSNNLNWTSKYQEGNEILWNYKDNRPILKWQMN